MMKRTILFILTVLVTVSLSAQSIRVTSFQEGDATSTEYIPDFSGNICASIQIPTKDRSFCFEAGLAGIVDVQYSDSDITVYLPTEAKVLSISHKSYGVLRDWVIPAVLKEGGCYVLTLQCEQKKMTPVRFVTTQMGTPANYSSVKRTTSVSPYYSHREEPMKSLSRSFLDMTFGMTLDGDCTGTALIGVNYTYVAKRIGPYLDASLRITQEEDYIGSIAAGAALRLTSMQSATDFQIYSGVGVDMTSSLVVDGGARIGFASRKRVSRWDFGIGCMYSGGEIIPKISLGMGICGMSVIIGLCIAGTSI